MELVLMLGAAGMLWWAAGKKRVSWKGTKTVHTSERRYGAVSGTGATDDRIGLRHSISRKSRYINRKLMSVWYDKLRRRSHDDDDTLRTLRKDWSEYMEVFGNSDTYEYLLRETDGSESDGYRRKHGAALERIAAIEDSFAAAIGRRAVSELARVRDTDPSRF